MVEALPRSPRSETLLMQGHDLARHIHRIEFDNYEAFAEVDSLHSTCLLDEHIRSHEMVAPRANGGT